ncbi:unnamed protein product [Rotaria sp. Silwood2]|nr:unnamed protein product [Rotaria sp. Silwood2]CAF2846182.1 unnamed protein product [Rotaria sp. Silwood2]CAF4288594.1 unnamed protein product [Rotaria sp. Silwood2]CAF4407443.1 unnamed protein product [Rotaria sp. Silwood2]CAF4787108.1 unnamed protein product [Rotaria sp. Silwood2]
MENVDSELSKHDWIQRCKALYNGIETKMKTLLEFEETYEIKESLRWLPDLHLYFLYLIKYVDNQISNGLFCIVFFLVDLYRQLEQEQTNNQYISTTTCYRGQCMSDDELKSLQESYNLNRNSLTNTCDNFYIIANTFLSTTSNRQTDLAGFSG